MTPKKVFAWIGKAVLGAVIAFALLTGFAMLYYNIPVHAPSESGATDHTWQSDKFYSRFTEGISFGKTNNEGYQNLFDYEEGMPIDVLIMGSSHVEGFNVSQSKSMNAVLGELMGDAAVYNIGLSGHTFLNTAQNLRAALEKYHPEYVVVEAFNLAYSSEDLQAALNGTLPEIPAGRGGIISALQTMPYVRLLSSQLKSFMGTSADEDKSSAPAEIAPIEDYVALITEMKAIANEYGSELIIMHHAPLTVQSGADPTSAMSAELRSMFTSICADNGIPFVDMTDTFIDEYHKSSTLPHGFINTSVGSGHLNARGHRMIAEKLCETIEAIKEGN